MSKQQAMSKRSILNYVGILILITGVGFGAFRYWQNSPPTPDSDDADGMSLMYDSKVYQRQVETMVGKFGVVTGEWIRALSKPRGVAVTIIVVSILAAASCFLIASRMPRD